MLNFSLTSITANNSDIILFDNEDDVIDGFSDSGETFSCPNVDITHLKYEKNDKIITITLTVKGEIENRGNIDDFYGEGSDDMSVNGVTYEIELLTDQNTYKIIYMNNDLLLLDNHSFEDSLEPISYQTSGSELEVIFELKSEDEEYDSLRANSYDMKIVGFTGHWYFDEVLNSENKDITLSLKKYSFGRVKAYINNTGNTDINDENTWTISLNSLKNDKINITKEGVISSLNSSEEVSIQTPFNSIKRYIGRVFIQLSVDIKLDEETNRVYQIGADAFVLGRIVYVYNTSFTSYNYRV